MLQKLFLYIGGNRLHKAAQVGDVARMRKLIAKGADVNAIGPQGSTPLFLTANTGTVEGAKLLLDNGANINHTIPEGGQALHSALLKRHTDLAHLLLDRGADIDKPTSAGVTPLHLAALSGLTAIMGRLIRSGANIHALTEQGQSAIYCAMAHMTLSQTNDASGLRMLFAAGVDPRKGAEVVEENMAGFSDAAKSALRNELETLAKNTDDAELRVFVESHLASMSGTLLSAVVGSMTQSDDEDTPDWWYSRPIAIPFWGDRKIPVVYEFSPVNEPKFVAVADIAITNFLKLTETDKLALTPLLDENCRAVCENIDLGPGSAELKKRWLSSEDRTTLWQDVAPPESIRIQRRHRRDEDIYVHMSMDCGWEEEHGLQLVFRRGQQLTRISQQDGWLTDADAYALLDKEDKLLSAFGKKAKK